MSTQAEAVEQAVIIMLEGSEHAIDLCYKKGPQMQYYTKAKAEQQKRKQLARLWFGGFRAGATLSH